MVKNHNSNDVLFFLKYGFLPSIENNASSLIFPENDLSALEVIPKSIQNDEEALVKRGVEALHDSFSQQGDGQHIVPLSGGLDSRVIIAGLIKAGLKEKITAVSFGDPGAYDFEIASLIARKLGIRHDVFDLNTIPVSENSLIQTAKNGSSWTLLVDGFYNSLIPKKYGLTATYWSGFMGGELAGAHLPTTENTSWQDAKEYFLSWNSLHKHEQVGSASSSFVELLPDSPLYDRSIISYDDQLDFMIRQINYIKKAIIFDGFNYQSPFLSRSWVNFSLTIHRKHRINKSIYKKILVAAYPNTFSLPITNNFGGPINISKPNLLLRRAMTRLKREIEKQSKTFSMISNPLFNAVHIFNSVNYIDFDRVIREREDFKGIIEKSLSDLHDRDLFDNFDPSTLLGNHCDQRNNYGILLMLLNALEISLKSEQ